MILTLAAKALKAVLPGPVRRTLQRARQRSGLAERAFAGLSTQDVFEKIYRTGAWGKDSDGAATSGSGAHNQAIIAPYIAEVARLMSAPDIRVAVDLGCGDFNVGKHFVDVCDSYIACDIADTVLDMNRARHQAASLTFRRLDIAEDDLPAGDIAFVRQVLQHLSNAEIAKFVRKLNADKPYGYLLVTEHLPAKDFVPNIDKPTGAECACIGAAASISARRRSRSISSTARSCSTCFSPRAASTPQSKRCSTA